MRHRSALRLLPVATFGYVVSTGLHAELEHPLVDDVQKVADPATKDRKPGLVALPIPSSNPTLGTGLALAGLLLYDMEGSTRPWMSGLGGFYTSTDSWGVGAFQKAYLLNDKVRASAVLAYADVNVEFFGVGSGAGELGASIPINQKGTLLMLDGLGAVAKNLYVGARYRFLSLTTSVNLPTDILPGLPIGDPQLDAISSGLGLVAQYDTRDIELNPSQGTYVTFDTNFAREALGSDFDYQSARLAFNHYLSLDDDKVLAMRFSGCAVGGRVPFYELCLFGTRNDLRGYVGGRYRDKYMAAVQAEYRWRFHGRWGLVLFAGVGEVAHTLGDFDGDDLLPSAGAGLRFLASKDYKVNASVDFAVGKDESALYFYISEAF